MKPTRFTGANKVYVVPGDEEGKTELPVQQALVQDETLGFQHAFISVWELTDEERQQIADGAYVALQVIGQGLPPVALWVVAEDPDIELPPDDAPAEEGEAQDA